MAKQEISINIVGKKVTLIIEGETFSKNVNLAADRNALKEKVVAYNKKNTVKLAKEIKAYVETVKAVKDAKSKAKPKKAPATKPVEATKAVSPEIAKEVVKAEEDNIKKPEPVTAPKAYYGRREY